jgi:hypothetical protein
VAVGDQEELTKILRGVLSGQAPAYAKASAGRQGKQRAEKHFRWERILADYLPLYRPTSRLVPLDSATLYNAADVAEWHTRMA